MNRDKPRITSTVIISIFLLINIILTCSLFMIGFKSIKAEEGQEAGIIFVALFAGVGIVFVLLIYAAIVVSSGVCLAFSVANRKSTLKPVRIISYCYDGLLAAVIVTSIIKIILTAIGII